jgi:cell division protein FtsN
MTNPFDQEPTETQAVNLTDQPPEPTSVAPEEVLQTPDFSNDSVMPEVGGGSNKKKFALLIAVVLVLVLGGLGFVLSSSGSSAPEVPVAPLAKTTAPVSPQADPIVPIAPVAPVDTAVPLPTAPAATAAVHPCEQRMIDYANQNGADAKAYVAQNQAYLAECKKAMEAGAK